MLGDVVCDPGAVEAAPVVAASADVTDAAALSPFACAVADFVDCPAAESVAAFASAAPCETSGDAESEVAAEADPFEPLDALLEAVPDVPAVELPAAGGVDPVVDPVVELADVVGALEPLADAAACPVPADVCGLGEGGGWFAVSEALSRKLANGEDWSLLRGSTV
jgi:hypothetical protein